MTEKLYYADSHMKSFTAKVLSCSNEDKRFAVELDKTAFFPEGGGQAADTGTIGGVRVLDVREKGGHIIHYTENALDTNISYPCEIDWEQRFKRMQGHSGEHIVSGIVYSRFGFNNVGFHMGADGITIDFDGEISAEELNEIELAANRAVWENVPVRAEFPSSEELKTLQYRSKLDLTEDVRIVTVEGYDTCACCAPHVSRTGEIGIIKFTDLTRHRGGVRITMLCGVKALEDYIEKQNSAAEISNLLSAKRDAIYPAVKRMNDELQTLKYQNSELKKRVLDSQLEKTGRTEGNLCFIEPAGFDSNSLRYIVNEAVRLCSGMAAAFSGGDGEGYNYVIASESMDMRSEAKLINSSLNGRGGGKSEMIQGSVQASRAEIEKYFERKV